MSHLETMIKNILAVIGSLTLLLITLYLASVAGMIYSEHKEKERLRDLSFTEVQSKLKEDFDKIIINGALCDGTASGESENCKNTEESSESFKTNLLDLSEMVLMRCSETIKENVTPTFVDFYKLTSLNFYQRQEVGLFYNNEVVQEAFFNSMKDIILFDYQNNCSTGKGTIIESLDSDYSAPHDSKNFQ
jgi:cell division protein FtsL